MSWTGKRVLVTGAGGFIGSHLAERLVELGAVTRALVEYDALGSRGWLDGSELRGDLEIVVGDVRDRDTVRQAVSDAQVVFHLAALIAIPYSYTAPASYVHTNVLGTLNVLQVARELGVERVVHTSSSEVYGTAQQVPITENHPLVAQSPYAASKIGADQLAGAFARSYGLPVVTVRPFNTYGPRQSARAVIPTIITQCLTGSVIELGNLTPTRDFTFVGDVVEGFCKAALAEDALGQTVNLGAGQEIAIGDLAERIVRLAGSQAQVESQTERVRPAASEVDRLLADTELARTLLGWTPQVELDEGLERTIAWVRENLDRYRPGDYVE